MAVSVRIPTPLRQYTNGQGVVAAEGATVGAVLESLVKSYPNLKPRLYEESGAVRRYVRVSANSQMLAAEEIAGAQVKDGDEISIVPAIAGGA
jgi:sulfur-carrier protein